MPESKLFSEDQNPITASVILTPKPGSNFLSNKHMVEGIQKHLLMLIPGLLADNITIFDTTGIVLNDFSGKVIYSQRAPAY